MHSLDSDGLTPYMAARLSLTKSFSDESKFEEYPDDPDWVIAKVWPSNNSVDDVKIVYYA